MSYSNLFFDHKLYIQAYLSLINIKRRLLLWEKGLKDFQLKTKILC